MDTSRVYGEAALNDACVKIASAPHGSRNASLFRESVAIFELVAGGVLDLESTVAALLGAAEATGLPRSEAKTVLRSAYRKGSLKPRCPKARPSEFIPQVPRYPAEADLHTLRRCSRSVLLDFECETYLRSRDIDPERVSRGGLARAVRFDEVEAPPSVPRHRGVAATKRGYCLAVELVDGLGVARSCVLRLVVAGVGPKSLTLKGARSKLVFANAAARALLTEKKRPPLWGDESLEVYIVEGEIDYLVAATEPTEAMRAVLGIASGSWCTRFAVSIPRDARVVIATDDDEAGERLAKEVRATLDGYAVGRWKPYIPGEDYADAGGSPGGEITWT